MFVLYCTVGGIPNRKTANMPFHLPSEILCNIIEEYLTIWDVGVLDTACCNKQWRPLFLSFIQNTTIRYKIVISTWEALDNSKMIVLWILTRQCGVESLTFSLTKLDLLDKNIGLLNNKLKELNIFLYDRCELTRAHYLTIASCNSLKSIFFDFQISELDLNTVLSKMPSLTHIHVSGKSVMMTDGLLLKIGRMHPFLNQVVCCTEATFNLTTIQTFQTSCKLLESMYVNNVRIV